MATRIKIRTKTKIRKGKQKNTSKWEFRCERMRIRILRCERECKLGSECKCEHESDKE